MEIIKVRDLKKTYEVRKKDNDKEPFGRGRRFIKEKKDVVNQINFTIDKGEMVGFIGPNGAGKSTTIKMLSGILVPTAGEVVVNGNIPYKKRKVNAKILGVVFGQKSQLWWNLPVRDSFDIIKTIYQIPDKRFRDNFAEFSELLEIDQYMDTQVRQLSLGQRMRVEVALSLMHDPEIVLLDEHTIGLDIIARHKIQQFIQTLNRERKTTILLTTHDMRDIEQLCKRIIVIDKGCIIYDGTLDKVKREYGKDRMLILDLENDTDSFHVEKGTLVKEEGARKYVSFNRDEITPPQMLDSLSKDYIIKDFSLVETDIDSIISRIYESGL